MKATADPKIWRCNAKFRGGPWPFGRPGTVKQRYYDWIERGVFDDIFAALGTEADLEWLSIDSTIVRAHQHAAGARRKKGGLMPRALAAHAAA